MVVAGAGRGRRSDSVRRTGVSPPVDGTMCLLRQTGHQLTEVTAAAGGWLFAGDNRGGRLLVLYARTGRDLWASRMPGPVRGVLAGLGSVLVTAGSAVVRVNPVTLRGGQHHRGRW